VRYGNNILIILVKIFQIILSDKSNVFSVDVRAPLFSFMWLLFHASSMQCSRISLELLHLCWHLSQLTDRLLSIVSHPTSETLTSLNVKYESNYCRINIQYKFILRWDNFPASTRMPLPLAPSTASIIFIPLSRPWRLRKHYLILTSFCLLADSSQSSGWSSGTNHVMVCYAQCGRQCRPQVHQFPLLPPPHFTVIT
jgi:hypothetical protein